MHPCSDNTEGQIQLTSGSDLTKRVPVTVDEVADTMAQSILADITNGTANGHTLHQDTDIPAGPPPLDRPCQLVKEFLLKISPEFIRVTQLRDRGWYENKAEGDAFFKRQRERADNADEEARKRFHKMMLKIADEMERVTGALRIKPELHTRVLDICMAPGGYTIAAIRYNPNCKVHAITLPEDQGGHPIIIDKKNLQGLQLLDITYLIKEFYDGSIPRDHPDRDKFIPIRPFKFYKFALVFCDGMVLRTQDRPSYRQNTEITRLACSQLILAMQRVQSGGTIIMLLHKVDSWPSALILYTFSKFAQVQVFKPSRAHASRSSFYMVAKDIDTKHDDAIDAIAEWKRIWYQATFGGPDGLGVREEADELAVHKVLTEFGDRLSKLGINAWKIQADALEKANFADSNQKYRTREKPTTPDEGSKGRPESTKFKLGRETMREPEPSVLGLGLGLNGGRESVSTRSPPHGWKERRDSIASMESWRGRPTSSAFAAGPSGFKDSFAHEPRSP